MPRISVCYTDCPWTHFVVQEGLELIILLTQPLKKQGFQPERHSVFFLQAMMCTTNFSLLNFFLLTTIYIQTTHLLTWGRILSPASLGDFAEMSHSLNLDLLGLISSLRFLWPWWAISNWKILQLFSLALNFRASVSNLSPCWSGSRAVFWGKSWLGVRLFVQLTSSSDPGWTP